MLVLCPNLTDFAIAMKKLLSVIALLAFVSVVLVGCKPADDTGKTGTTPATNAPAPPK
jgi:hypothetical protein